MMMMMKATQIFQPHLTQYFRHTVTYRKKLNAYKSPDVTPCGFTITKKSVCAFLRQCMRY